MPTPADRDRERRCGGAASEVAKPERRRGRLAARGTRRFAIHADPATLARAREERIAERLSPEEDRTKKAPWRKWGPYLEASP